MNIKLEARKELSKRIIQICKKYNIRRIYLVPIIRRYSRGLKRCAIADELGITRDTMTRYFKRIGKMSDKEIKQVYKFCLGIE